MAIMHVDTINKYIAFKWPHRHIGSYRGLTVEDGGVRQSSIIIVVSILWIRKSLHQIFYFLGYWGLKTPSTVKLHPPFHHWPLAFPLYSFRPIIWSGCVGQTTRYLILFFRWKFFNYLTCLFWLPDVRAEWTKDIPVMRFLKIFQELTNLLNKIGRNFECHVCKWHVFCSHGHLMLFSNVGKLSTWIDL